LLIGTTLSHTPRNRAVETSIIIDHSRTNKVDGKEQRMRGKVHIYPGDFHSPCL
jgi:hypothetical protein